MRHDPRAQHVQYLSVSTDLLPGPTLRSGKSMIVITIRPEPGQSWQTQGLALTVSQAIRLRKDLGAILRKCGLVLLLSALALAECSGRVEVRQERPATVRTADDSSGQSSAASSAAATETGGSRSLAEGATGRGRIF